MWNIKKFKSIEAANKWLEKMDRRIQWVRIFIANCPAAIEWRFLRVIDIQ